MTFLHTILSEIAVIRQEKKDLKSFAWVIAAACMLFALFSWYKHGDLLLRAQLLFAVAGLVLVIGLLQPLTLKFPHRLWMLLAVVLGYFMTRLILFLAYCLLVAPMGLLTKLMKKDIMAVRWPETKATSFWRKNHTDSGREQFTKMY